VTLATKQPTIALGDWISKPRQPVRAKTEASFASNSSQMSCWAGVGNSPHPDRTRPRYSPLACNPSTEHLMDPTGNLDRRGWYTANTDTTRRLPCYHLVQTQGAICNIWVTTRR